MSIHTGVHLDDRSVIETHDCSAITPGRGYLRLRPLADSIVIASVIHGDATEMRRLAHAARTLADELDGTNARRVRALEIEALGQRYHDHEEAS